MSNCTGLTDAKDVRVERTADGGIVIVVDRPSGVLERLQLSPTATHRLEDQLGAGVAASVANTSPPVIYVNSDPSPIRLSMFCVFGGWVMYCLVEIFKKS